MSAARARRGTGPVALARVVLGLLMMLWIPQVRAETLAAPLELDEVHRRIPVLPREQLAELARWGDSLGVHVTMGLPARFAPRIEHGRPLYRPCDVIDLVAALGKRPDESWDDWRARDGESTGPLVQLRSRPLH